MTSHITQEVDAVLVRMADACRCHLGPMDVEIVVRALDRAPERVGVMLTAYAGRRFEPPEFAAVMLGVAKRVLADGGAS